MNQQLPGAAILKYEEDIVRTIRELIAIPSVRGEPAPGKPFGEEVDRALHYMLSLGEKLGFRTRNVDGYAGHVEFGEGDDYIGVLVHLDVVPAGDGWTVDPFGGVVRDGLIIGRGAGDDKGPAVVALYALAALRDVVGTPETKVRVIFGTDEENGMGDMDHYFAKEPLPKYGFTPDASYPIIHAEKEFFVLRLREEAGGGSAGVGGSGGARWRISGGQAPNVVPDRCVFEVELSVVDAERLLRAADAHPDLSAETADGRLRLAMRGKVGHGSYPPSGVNAIAKMLEFLAAELPEVLAESKLLSFVHERIGHEAFGESLGIAVEDPKHGKLTNNFAMLEAGGGAVPNAVLNVRVPVTSDGAAMLRTLRALCASLGIAVDVEEHLPPLYVPEDHPLIVKLGKAYEAVMNEPIRLLSIGGGTYARKLGNRGVAFGPGFPGRNHGPGAHQPDETVSIADLMLHGQICTQAMYELQKK